MISSAKALIQLRIEQSFQPSYLEVVDESDKHRGHAGYQEGGSHYAIKMKANCFNTMNRVEAHRQIYAVLADLIPTPIHALRIEILR